MGVLDCSGPEGLEAYSVPLLTWEDMQSFKAAAERPAALPPLETSDASLALPEQRDAPPPLPGPVAPAEPKRVQQGQGHGADWDAAGWEEASPQAVGASGVAADQVLSGDNDSDGSGSVLSDVYDLD